MNCFRNSKNCLILLSFIRKTPFLIRKLKK
nr:MAG TPA: DNA-binding protein [Caudoviricetes sp.]